MQTSQAVWALAVRVGGSAVSLVKIIIITIAVILSILFFGRFLF
jgi:hypothetical protein